MSTAADQGIYIGEKAPLATSAFAPFVSVRRPSQIPPSSSSSQQINTTAIPPPKPPRTDLNVLQELEMQKKNKNKIVEQEVEEIGNKQQQQLALGLVLHKAKNLFFLIFNLNFW
uniref:Uncharacterized protein n=1 Tax=Meloidogyne enterolobii TaxID=390850 RepID=A0A6V7WRB7_MELEN|nr:unnamed protein product [Meloidogyne enterolobii]